MQNTISSGLRTFKELAVASSPLDSHPLLG